MSAAWWASGGERWLLAAARSWGAGGRIRCQLMKKCKKSLSAFNRKLSNTGIAEEEACGMGGVAGDMAWRRRVLREEAVMERGLTKSALLAAAPVGTWSAKGYSSQPFKDPSKREGQIHPVRDSAVASRSRSRLLSKGSQNNSLQAPSSSKRAPSHGRGSEPLQHFVDGGPNNKSVGHPSLPGGRAGTPAASKKISDWMARSTRSEHFLAGDRPPEDDVDVYSQRSGFSAYSYSSGTSLQTYSGRLVPASV